MEIAVLGTGAVGKTLAHRLLELGHTVTVGTRSINGQASLEFLGQVDAAYADRADVAEFRAAAQGAELIILAVSGLVSSEVLRAVGAEALSGKTILDVTNPLDFSQGFPPRLAVCNDDSVGEQLQREFPDAHVVKTLNTVNCSIMANPRQLPGRHAIFVAGNDAGAKGQALDLLAEFGWEPDQITDLGDITGARATEMYLPLWLRLMGDIGNADFNIAIARP